jgi:hypothetical protein
LIKILLYIEEDFDNMILKTETLLAIQETEQIIEGYVSGTRTLRPFSNASEMFAVMDMEDEKDRDYE